MSFTNRQYSSTEASEELIQLVCAGLEPQANDDTRDLPAILRDTLVKYPHALTDDAVEDLERISAKVCVARNVFTNYSLDWRKLPEPELLDDRGWLGVTLTFLLYGERRLLPDNQNKNALALKFLNTALKAFDHIKRSEDGGTIEKLGKILGDRLAVNPFE
jgi:hypothetical protein